MQKPEATVPLYRLNLAVHGLEGEIKHGGNINSYYDDPHDATGRFGAKVATYGQLADQVQRFSAALQALGLPREARVLLLMHDSSDWVVAFLGALHAGVVPVAVNTLLTAHCPVRLQPTGRIR